MFLFLFLLSIIAYNTKAPHAIIFSSAAYYTLHHVPSAASFAAHIWRNERHGSDCILSQNMLQSQTNKNPSQKYPSVCSLSFLSDVPWPTTIKSSLAILWIMNQFKLTRSNLGTYASQRFVYGQLDSVFISNQTSPKCYKAPHKDLP